MRHPELWLSLDNQNGEGRVRPACPFSIRRSDRSNEVEVVCCSTNQEVLSMKRIMLLLIGVLAAATFASAQPDPNWHSPTDVLGAHLVSGRGCIACHAPHSGARGNGISTTDTTSGDAALWGADVTPYYNQTFAFGDAGGFPSRPRRIWLQACMTRQLASCFA